MFAPGEHRYSIRYRATRQLGLFKDYDELYWNVTGNGWVFPIDARRSAHPPAQAGHVRPARLLYRAPGLDRAATPRWSRKSRARSPSARPRRSAPYEGLTVAVAFPKGVVAEPSEAQPLGWWLADYGPPMRRRRSPCSASLGFLSIAWQRAGRDPRAGTVVPLFAPPDDLSPAAMRYVIEDGRRQSRLRRGADRRRACAGHVRMVEEEGGWFFGATRPGSSGSTGAAARSPPTSKRRSRSLCRPGRIARDGAEEPRQILGRQEELGRGLQERSSKASCSSATAAGRAPAWSLFVGAIVADLPPPSSPATDDASIVADRRRWRRSPSRRCCGIVLYGVRQRDRQAACCRASRVLRRRRDCGLATGLPIFDRRARTAAGWLPLLLPALGLPLALSAFCWISAPDQGRPRGARPDRRLQTISVDHRARAARPHAPRPRDTPQLFERYLPYAIALGVENRWADRFAGRARGGRGRRASRASPGIRGRSSPWNDTGGFADSVGSSLSSTISSASTAPGSSSGSGGGGSSGGGGGGGGGGGW